MLITTATTTLTTCAAVANVLHILDSKEAVEARGQPAAGARVPALSGTAALGPGYFVASMIASRRIRGIRSRISSGVASGGDRQIVSPVAGSALPGRMRVSRPRDIASR